MKFFIDTANVDEIRKANDMGIICGVTTNPSLIAKEGRDFKQVIQEITSIVDGPISGEVNALTTDAEGMIKEGREIAAIHPNMVVKIPMTAEGLKATKVLSEEGIKVNVTLIFSANQALLAARAGAAYVSPFVGRLDDISLKATKVLSEEGIKVNVTLIFSANQALLAARAGAAYVSPFVGRLDDISQPGVELIETIMDIFETHGIETEVIAASIRTTMHVTECAQAGADIATVPYKILEQMLRHPLTDQGIEKFQADYKAVFGEK